MVSSIKCIKENRIALLRNTICNEFNAVDPLLDQLKWWSTITKRGGAKLDKNLLVGMIFYLCCQKHANFERLYSL